jgi:transposase
MGLLKTRGRQRTDSTHVLGAIRALNRLETAGETLRLALNTLATVVPDWLQRQIPAEWVQRYGTPFQAWHLPQSEADRKTLIDQIGQDGRYVLTAIDHPAAPEGLWSLPAIEILRQVWIQQFYIEDEHIRWRTPAELPPASIAINSPHDADARYSKKRATIWVGYKVHLTETCDDAAPRLITHVLVKPAPVADTNATATIHTDLAAADQLPATHLVDAGYVDAAHLVASEQEHQIDLVGPVPINGTWQAKAGEGFAAAAFSIDWEAKVAICPQGKQSHIWRQQHDGNGNPTINITFAAADCQSCPVRAQCTKAKQTGRQLNIREHDAFECDQNL